MSSLAAPADNPADNSISLAEARRLLADRHKIAVDDDDPILMSVTLHQAFLADYQAMLLRHEATLVGRVSTIAEHAEKHIAGSADALRGELVDSAVKNVMEAVAQNAKTSGLIQDRLNKQLLAQGVLTGLTWLAVIILFFILK